MTALVAAEPTSEERTLALISHALSFIEGGVFAPLLMYVLRAQVGEMLYKGSNVPDSEFVAFHSLQSTYFGLLFLAITLPVVFLTCGFGAIITVPLYLYYEVVACIRANSGEWYRLPLAGDWAALKHPPPRR